MILITQFKIIFRYKSLEPFYVEGAIVTIFSIIKSCLCLII